MTKRLALTPAVGLFAGLSVVSYGAMSMLFTGVHEARQAATNPCSASASAASPAPTTTAARMLPGTKPRVRTASQVSGRAQHPAGMPVLLARAVRLASASSSPPLPGTSPQPSASASPPVLPQPSPISSAGPGTAPPLPQPIPAQSTSKSNHLTPGGTIKSPNATPTPTPTPTRTSTPTPTPTTTPTRPPGTLCLKIQTLDNVSSVDPHTTVRYAIWVWLSSGTNGTAKITLSASPSSVSPTFTVCAPSGRSDCKVGGLNAGAHVQLQAKLKAPGRSHHHVTLTATATSADASNSASASATVDVKRKKSSHNDSSSQTQNAGDGGTFPLNNLPTGTVSGLAGLGVQPTGDLGSAFPQVSPSPSASGATATRSHGHSTKMIDLSAGLPLDVRLIGGQVIGLAVLAAAITIAVARLSLRKQPQPPGEDSSGKS